MDDGGAISDSAASSTQEQQQAVADISVQHIMEHDDLNFDEPAVKHAVQQAWGGERAPQRLRGRVGRLMATAGSIDDATSVAVANSGAGRWRHYAYGLAAAAAVILGVGLLVLYYQGTFERLGNGGESGYAAIVPSTTDVPLALAQSMVATHAACGKLHDHHTVGDLDGNTYAALNVKLTADLGFPTVARRIGSDWTFKGASTCDVGGLRGAHLVFARGGETISVFSLPSSCAAGVPAGARYAGTLDGHALAGFVRPGATYAVIGSDGGGTGDALLLQSVTGIRDALLSTFDPDCGPHESGADLPLFD